MGIRYSWMIGETVNLKRRKKTRSLRHKFSAISFLLPALLIMSVVVFYPMIFAITRSLFDWSFLKLDVLNFIGFSNYKKAFQDSNLLYSLFVTSIYTVSCVIPTVCIGLFLAVLVNRIHYGKSIIRALLLIPMMMAPVAVGLAWKLFLWDSHFGLINYFLSFLGIHGPSWLSFPATAVISIIITSIWVWTPFPMLVLEAALSKLPISPFEAAMLDGASAWQTFWHLTLPMIKSPLMFVILIRITTDFRIFDIINVMTDGGPGMATQLLSMYTFFTAMRKFNLGYANAIGVIMMIVVASLCIGLLKVILKTRKGVSEGGLWEE